MAQQAEYWFPAKRRGWGWGVPQTWQGWLVLVTYVTGVVTSQFIFPPQTALLAWTLCMVLSTAGLLLICWLKGEPPRWR